MGGFAILILWAPVDLIEPAEPATTWTAPDRQTTWYAPAR